MTALAQRLHDYDCANPKNRGSHIADGLNRMQDLVDGPIAEILAAKDAEIAGLRAVLADFGSEGLRFDLNPTHDCSSVDSREKFWHNYIRRADETIRNRAISALAGEG